MSKILFGRYIPGDTIIYRIDPRAKILYSFLYIIIIFLANNWQSYTALVVLTLIPLLSTGLSVKTLWNGVKPLVWLILFTSLLQLFFGGSGHVYLKWGIIQISAGGIVTSIYVFLRFTLIILISTILTLTTMPLEIADGIEYLLTPLKFFRVPVQRIALIMSIALRFVPTLFDQAIKIMNAQRARGADFNDGSILKRMKSIVPLFVPLFISSLNTALDLSTAMEARGYQENAPRSKYRLLQWSKVDLLVLGYFCLSVVVLLITRVR